MGRNLPDYTILYKVRVVPTNPQPSPDGPHLGTPTPTAAAK
jgi:hypothetical protein